VSAEVEAPLVPVGPTRGSRRRSYSLFCASASVLHLLCA